MEKLVVSDFVKKNKKNNETFERMERRVGISRTTLASWAKGRPASKHKFNFFLKKIKSPYTFDDFKTGGKDEFENKNDKKMSIRYTDWGDKEN